MEHPYGEQYSQEGNPRAYMTMRDYRDLPYQWQQPVERNPSEYRSMRDYRDQWTSSPNVSTYNHSWGNHTNSSWEPRPPPQYDHPEPPFYPSTHQSPQLPQSIPPFEQAILDLTRIVDDFVEENKEINAHSFVTVEDNLNKKIDGLKDDFEHKWDNLQDSIEDLINQQQCPPEEDCQSDIMAEEQRVVTVQANQETETVESSLNKELDGFQSEIDQKLDILQESISNLTNQFVHLEEENLEEECLTETILVEQAQLQPQDELKMESVEAPEELQDAPESSVNFLPWTKEEHASALISEEGSGKEIVEDPQKHVLQTNPTNPTTTATSQDTKYPLPVAPSVDQVYILPSPAPQPTPATKSKPAAPAPKGKSNPSLHVMQNIKEPVAIAQDFATPSKKMATAYIAWHSGWFGCGFGFGAPVPRHF